MRLLWHRLLSHYYLRGLKSREVPVSLRDYLMHSRGPDLRKSILDTEFVVFDTETTGLHVAKGDRIVSISAVRLKEARIDLADTFHALINPNRDIPSTSAVVHEILPRMVAGKPTIDRVLPDFVQFAGNAVLVGHHVWLDLSFLNGEMMRLFGFPFRNVVVDTALLDQALSSKKPRDEITLNTTLGALAERYHVSMDEQHSSFGDVLVTAQIFQNMMKQMQKDGRLRLKDLLQMAFTPVSSRDHPGMCGT